MQLALAVLAPDVPHLYISLPNAFIWFSKIGIEEWSSVLLERSPADSVGWARKQQNLASKWFQYPQSFSTVFLDKLLLVIDDCGTKNMDFVDAIINSGDRFLYSHLDKSVRSHGFVLCGTSSDILKRQSGRYPLGPRPPAYTVSIMQRPRLDKLKDVSGVKRKNLNAISKETYSSLLATNVRILTRALIPLYESFYPGNQYSRAGDLFLDDGAEDGDTQKLIPTGIHSPNWLPISFVPHAYMAHNRMKILNFSQRENVLKVSFRFLMCHAIFGEGDGGDASQFNTEILNKIMNDEKQDKEIGIQDSMFEYGIMNRDPTLTSPALKLLACKGFSGGPILPKDGNLLQRVVAFVLTRQLGVCGYLARVYILRGDWPHGCTSMDDSTDASWTSEMGPSSHELDMRVLKSFFSVSTKRAVVLLQGVNNAEDLNVFVMGTNNNDKGVNENEDNEDASSIPSLWDELDAEQMLRNHDDDVAMDDSSSAGDDNFNQQ